MKLTPSTLKDLIQQVYLEAFAELLDSEDFELPAEPVGNEDPPGTILSEELKLNKIYKILVMLSSTERSQLFRRFGYYTGKHLLNQLNNIKKAEKGDL